MYALWNRRRKRDTDTDYQGEEMKTIFVYGSLKKGYYNHSIIKGSTFVGTKVLLGYQLYDTGFGYPAIAKDKWGSVLGEVYQIEEDIFNSINNMELGAGYVLKRGDSCSYWIMEKISAQWKKLGKEWRKE